MEPTVETATAYAIAHARRRGAAEATADDILVGCLQSLARFGVVDLGVRMIDLEELGVNWRDPSEAPGAKVAYSDSAVRLFDEAAKIAGLDPPGARGGAPMRIAHLLVAAEGLKDACPRMRALMRKHKLTSAEWRIAVSRHFPVPAGEPPIPAASGARSGSREYLSPEEAAQELGVHVQTMRVYVRTGKIPAMRLAGERAIRIRREDLSKVLEPLPSQG
jgi:excisionase family DNA binding protein